MIDLKVFDDVQLLQSYVAEAAWFWFDPSTHEKSLEVGLHRVAAHYLLKEVRRRGLDEPAADDVYRHARRTFPLDDLCIW